jgi:hypothetical protein
MTETLFCYVHPSRSTALRCNNCERPICVSCAVRTPTGYRCKECVKGQLKKFDTALWYDNLFAFAMAGILSLVASLLAGLVGGFSFIMFFIIGIAASTAGVIIAEAVRFVTRRRRSRPLFMSAVAGMLAGALPVILIQIFLTMDFWGLAFQVLYLFIATPVMYSRLSGFQLFK